MGVERTPNKSQHTKLTLEKKILLPLLPGFELATFRSQIRRSNQQAIPLREQPDANSYTLSSQGLMVIATHSLLKV